MSISPISFFGNSYVQPLKKSFDTTNKEFEQYKEKINSEVMEHEKAHQQVAGELGGPIVIEKGSDGVAIGGHVPILIPEVTQGNAEITKEKNERVRAAALAPKDPSSQDYFVAAQAQANINKALMFINKKDSDN